MSLVLFLFILFFPLLPEVWGADQSIIFKLTLFLCIFLSLGVNWKLMKNTKIVTFFLLFSFLVQIPSFIKEFLAVDVSISIFVILINPIIYLILFYGILSLLLKERNLARLKYRFLFSFFSITALYFLLESFFILRMWDFSNVISLWKRLDFRGISHSWVSFYGTTYYASYVFFSLYCLFLTSFMLLPSRIKFFILSILAVFIILAQSKVMILCLLLASLLSMLLFGSRFFKFTSIFSCCFLFFLALSPEMIIILLREIPTTSAYSLANLLESPSTSGTLNVRLDQIYSVINLLSNYSGLFGVGFGKGVYLESWVAKTLFTGGFLYSLAFLVFSITLCFYSYRKYVKSKYMEHKTIYSGVFVWAFFLPLSQLSSLSFMQSKMALISIIVLSLFYCSVIKERD